MTLLQTRRGTPHVRGIERRRVLLESARTLLAERELDEISLGDVAAHAGVPKGSAYHFYQDIEDLYAALLVLTKDELLVEARKPITERVREWADIVWILTHRGVDFYERNPASLQLQVGPKTPPHLKLRDRQSDVTLAGIFQQHFAAAFVLPASVNWPQVFFRAVEIADLMFCLSVVESRRITQDMTGEAARAAIAYLKIYLPDALPRRIIRGRSHDERPPARSRAKPR